MTTLMQLNNVLIKRDHRTLFSKLSFPVTSGHITVILGANGAGKSSLLLAMAGLIPATGNIDLMGKPLHHYKPCDRTQLLAWQGELPPTAFGLTVKQRLFLVSNCAEKVERVALDMDIITLLSRPLAELSSGELQRVELAALLLRDAPVWLLDEPTSHLDLKHQISFIHTLKKHAAKGKGIVLILHDLQQAKTIADFLILIDKQGTVRYGKCGTLFNRQTLTQIFDASLIEQDKVLMPNYKGINTLTAS